MMTALQRSTITRSNQTPKNQTQNPNQRTYRDGWACLAWQRRLMWIESRHTSHVTRHTSHVTRHTSHVTCHTSHRTHHTSHITHHTSHIIHHTSHITHHTSHVTHHTSHITCQHIECLHATMIRCYPHDATALGGSGININTLTDDIPDQMLQKNTEGSMQASRTSKRQRHQHMQRGAEE